MAKRNINQISQENYELRARIAELEAQLAEVQQQRDKARTHLLNYARKVCAMLSHVNPEQDSFAVFVDNLTRLKHQADITLSKLQEANHE